MEVDALPDERLVRRLLLLAKVAQATVQPLRDGAWLTNPSLPYHQACPLGLGRTCV